MELEIADIASFGFYDVSFWIYFYCKTNCSNLNDRIVVNIVNEDDNVLANEIYMFNTESNKKEWKQKKLSIYNEAKNIKVKKKFINFISQQHK